MSGRQSRTKFWLRIQVARASSNYPPPSKTGPRCTERRPYTVWCSGGYLDCGVLDYRSREGGVMQPRDACTKTDELVIGVLCYKQPDACSYSDSNLSAYPGQPPELVLVKLTKDTVIEVAWRLSGGDGMGGIDFIRL